MTGAMRILFLVLGLWLSFTTLTAAQVVSHDPIELEDSQPIWELAREMGLAAEHLAWANDMDVTDRVQAGHKLEVPDRILPKDPPENGLVANLPERGFYLFLKGEYDGFYPIAIGQAKPEKYHSPIGQFEITSVIENPKWKIPDAEWARAYEKDTIAASAETNPLGNYWFGISKPGFGFHENVEPKYTGADISHGCMRLYPDHAKQLYDKLEVGMAAHIEYEPVRVFEAEEGTVYLAVFPDIYNRTDLLARAKELLQGYELKDDVDLQQIVEEASGQPLVVAQN